MNDKQIVKLLLERDESALSEIETSYGRLCKHIALNILESERDAEECVNDTYLKIWNSIPPLVPASFKAYILRVIKNISVNRIKHDKAAKRSPDSIISFDTLENIVKDSNEPLYEMYGDTPDLSDEINSFLDSLDKISRILFVRRYWYGDSLDYLAQISGYTKNNISQKLMRMRTALKAQLERKDDN